MIRYNIAIATIRNLKSWDSLEDTYRNTEQVQNNNLSFIILIMLQLANTPLLVLYAVMHKWLIPYSTIASRGILIGLYPHCCTISVASESDHWNMQEPGGGNGN